MKKQDDDPVPGDVIVITGMKLRDYFAAAALPSILLASFGKDRPPEDSAEIVAHAAYAIADALLSERERE